MKIIRAEDISDQVESLCLKCNFELPQDIFQSLIETEKKEQVPRAKKILQCLIENALIAKKEKIAICQDCGIGVFFVEIGQDIYIEGDLYHAIQQGMASAYKNGYLRKSMVKHPFIRENTGDNLPAVIHTEIKEHNCLVIYFAPKGAGSENCSKTNFFNPSATLEEIQNWIIEQTINAAKKACGPLILGIGIGGSSEYAPLLAKKALLRNMGERNPDSLICKMEESITLLANETGIGPQGLGGDITVLDTFIDQYPTHIAMLPVSINFQCHAARHGKIIWQ